MEKREDTPVEIYNRGKRIVDLIEKYSAFIPMANDEEKENLKEKVTMLNGAKGKIKDEIYEEAKKKSGLDYSKKEKNPEFLRKEYNDKLADFKKRKQELRLERIRLERLHEEKKAQRNQEFMFAKEKYEQMRDMKKITPEMCAARIKNMEKARINDIANTRDMIEGIKDEASKLDSQIGDIKGKLEDLEQKERIYNEYGDVYYRLFGEILVDRNKFDIPKENIDTKAKKDDENEKTNTDSSKKNSDEKPDKNKEPDNVEPKGNINTNANVTAGNMVNEDNETRENEETEPDVVITSKNMFNDLYQKMKKGIITDKELNALANTLSNPDNYDKYGITTGLVFNKAKKILKFQGARTAKNIDKFLRENNVFSDSIKFDPSIEKDNVLSHDVLNSWKDIDEKLTYTDSKFSIEEYIEKIEKYKEDGNELTREQEKMFKKAVDIKNNLSSYRKALNVNDDVTTSRDKMDRNSIFYIAFKDRHKAKSNRALPERTSRNDDPGYIVNGDNGLDLRDLTNPEPDPKEARGTETRNKTKSKEKSL